MIALCLLGIELISQHRRSFFTSLHASVDRDFFLSSSQPSFLLCPNYNYNYSYRPGMLPGIVKLHGHCHVQTKLWFKLLLFTSSAPKDQVRVNLHQKWDFKSLNPSKTRSLHLLRPKLSSSQDTGFFKYIK